MAHEYARHEVRSSAKIRLFFHLSKKTWHFDQLLLLLFAKIYDPIHGNSWIAINPQVIQHVLHAPLDVNSQAKKLKLGITYTLCGIVYIYIRYALYKY